MSNGRAAKNPMGSKSLIYSAARSLFGVSDSLTLLFSLHDSSQSSLGDCEGSLKVIRLLLNYEYKLVMKWSRILLKPFARLSSSSATIAELVLVLWEDDKCVVDGFLD